MQAHFKEQVEIEMHSRMWILPFQRGSLFGREKYIRSWKENTVCLEKLQKRHPKFLCSESIEFWRPKHLDASNAFNTQKLNTTDENVNVT